MKTKIFLELCCNHNGNFEIAKELIRQAAELNVFGVKLQKRDIESIPEYLKNQPRSLDNSYGKTYYEHRKALEFSIQQVEELKKIAEKKNLEFSCSVFDLKSVYDLIKINCKWIKIPSQLLLNEEMYNVLKERKQFKVAVSTGMHSYQEIVDSKWYKEADIRYYCVSEYPAENINLNFIKKLNLINGYSSHELNGEVIPYAVCMGLDWIERHFTYDKNSKGNDHKISSDFNEIESLLKKIQTVEKIMGAEDKDFSNIELKNRKIYRGF